jgi:hypothetical protein
MFFWKVLFYYNFSCSNSTIAANKVCTGKAENEACDPTKPVECEQQLYCSFKDNKCLRQKGFEEPCDDYEPKPIDEIPEGSNYNVICKGGR